MQDAGVLAHGVMAARTRVMQNPVLKMMICNKTGSIL
jgi:hypothetical protein